MEKEQIIRCYWQLTVILLAMSLAGWPPGHPLALGLCGVQSIHFAILDRSLTAFPVQVRLAYAGLLALALWEPLRFLLWVQLIGTSAMVVCDYCLLARITALMPWNRSQPFSLQLMKKTIFSRPVPGRIQA